MGLRNLYLKEIAIKSLYFDYKFTNKTGFQNTERLTNFYRVCFKTALFLKE